MIVLDCSAVYEIVRATPAGVAFRGLMGRGELVVSSTLLHAELADVFGRLVEEGHLEGRAASCLVSEALGLVDAFIGPEDYYQEALSESLRLGVSAFDLFYALLARRLGATLFTARRELVKLCEDNGIDCIHDEEGD